jgi:hypothetical protein
MLSESEGFDSLDPDMKEVVEMLLGNCSMFPEHLASPIPPVSERNLDTLLQDSTVMLQAVQIRDKPEAKKPPVPPWDPAKDALTDKANLLQEFMLESLSFASMRDREEEVAEAHRKTFEWIFATENSKKVGVIFCNGSKMIMKASTGSTARPDLGSLL